MKASTKQQSNRSTDLPAKRPHFATEGGEVIERVTDKAIELVEALWLAATIEAMTDWRIIRSLRQKAA
jgi:hypothetical protein